MPITPHIAYWGCAHSVHALFSQGFRSFQKGPKRGGPILRDQILEVSRSEDQNLEVIKSEVIKSEVIKSEDLDLDPSGSGPSGSDPSQI